MKVQLPQDSLKGLHPEKYLKIKIEVDTDPVLGFETVDKMLKQPIPISIQTLKLPDLFASKLHAALFRAWKNRVKGRDWYDVIWYIRNNIPVNLTYFNACLEHYAAHDQKIEKLSLLKHLVIEKIDKLDFDAAKSDIKYFAHQSEKLLIENWDKGFLKAG